MNDPLRIRGHHLLCMLGFRGLGYSEAFVANMRRVVDAVRANANLSLELLAEADAICAACPHLREGACSRGENGARPARRDVAVLSHLGYAPGEWATVAEVYARVGERVTPTELSERLCKGCSWLDAGYCVDGLTGLRRRNGSAGE